MDRCTLARAAGCTIQQHRYDSDHKPLVLGLSFSAPAVTADVPVEPPGRPLPKLHWNGSKKEDYVSHLRASGTALAECERMVSAGDPAAAFAKLGGVLIDAARAADCKHIGGSRPSRGIKPYFDQECRRMRAQFRYAMRHDPENVRILARRFLHHHSQEMPPVSAVADSSSPAPPARFTTSASGRSSIQWAVLCLPPWPTIQPGRHSIRGLCAPPTVQPAAPECPTSLHHCFQRCPGC